MNNEKVMISQPMKGLTEEKIRNNRAKIVDFLKNQGYEIMETIHSNYPTHLAEKEKAIPIWYLSKSIEYMSGVDVVFFMRGWQDARGCKIEHQIAMNYGLRIMYEEE